MSKENQFSFPDSNKSHTYATQYHISILNQSMKLLIFVDMYTDLEMVTFFYGRYLQKMCDVHNYKTHCEQYVYSPNQPLCGEHKLVFRDYIKEIFSAVETYFFSSV